MVHARACRRILITVCLLLGLTALGNTQSDTRRPQDPRGVTMAPATRPGSPSERRVALVIGNGQYHSVSPLDNPTKDAQLIAETLTAVGFTLVGGKAQLDLDKPAFDRAVQEFGTVIQGVEVALFYYAGHGVQVRGGNYLVPVSANPVREADIDFQLFNADLVLRQMEFARTRLNLLILDACRNNPFAVRGLRATGGGLAQMQAPEGTLISYATQPGNVAQDGTDGHGPYTRALANAIRKPGLDVFAVFNETGLDVKQRTGGAQQPWVSSSPIAGQFYFAGAPAQPPTGGKDDAAEIAFWNSVKDDKTPDAFQTYLESYPQGKFAPLARLKLKQLTEPPIPPPTSTSDTTPSPLSGSALLVGTWAWTCCTGKGDLSGTIEITEQDPDGTFRGIFNGAAGGSVRGKVTGNTVVFTREGFNCCDDCLGKPYGKRQTWKGQFVPRARGEDINGQWQGCREEMLTHDFYLTRSTK